MPIHMIIPRYTHNYAQFCQLLNSNLFTHHRIIMLLREATSETYGPRVYSHHINLHHFNLALLLLFTLLLHTKNTKNIISIRSHSRKWPWRAWQPLIVLVASSYRFVQVRGTWAWPPTGLIPWFSKTEGNTYATLLHHPFLFGENQRSAKRGSKKDFWRRCRGDLRSSEDIPSTHHKLFSLALHYLPFASRFPLPPIHPCHFIRPLSLYPPSLSLFALFVCLLFVCLCVSLLVCRDGSR